MDQDNLKFVVPAHVRPVRDKVLAFVEGPVYALEKEHGAALGMGVAGLHSDSAPSSLVEGVRRLQAMAKEQGLWALGHPKELGGGGMSFADYIYVNEVQGRSELAPVALGTHSLQDSLMIWRNASEPVKAKYLSKVVSAEIYPSFAMTEPDVVSSDPTQLQTSARVDEATGEWVVNGRKWWTSNAANAAFTTVFVRTEFGPDVPTHAAFSIILVPTSDPGYQIQRETHVLGLEGGDHSEVKYVNCRVPAANLLGKRGSGFQIAQERLGPGRIFHCMRWLGVAQRGFDLMMERLVERKVRRKGVEEMLGEQQLMQQHVFDSYCDIQALRLLTLSAAEKMDSGDQARVELAAAKAWGAQALQRVLDRAIQVYGAKGLTDDTHLAAMYRLSRAGRIYDGPDASHVITVGKLLLREYAQDRRYDFSMSQAQPKPKL